MNQPVTVEIERPLAAISQNLLHEYQQRDNKPWFTKLPDWQQRLVTFAIDSLAHGKMLSTQLRKYLPGPRNLYQRLIVQINGQHQQCIMNLYHSGTPGHELTGDGESLRATQLTVEALYDAIGCNHLYLNMLISPITVRLKELRLDEQFSTAIDNRHIHHVTTPLNGFRRMADNNLKQISIACEALGKSRARSEEGAWFLCIKHILQETILHADTSHGENPNLMIQGLFAYLITLLRDPRDQASLVACLSGKDRTGVLLMHASGLAMSLAELRRKNDQVIDLNKNPNIDLEQLCQEIKLTLESDDFNKNLRTNFIQLIGSGHIILLAGAIGATRGCARLKIDSISAVPDSLLPLFKPCLFGRCAMYNKQGPTLSIPTRIRSVINPQSALAGEENDEEDDDDELLLDEEVAKPKWCLFK